MTLESHPNPNASPEDLSPCPGSSSWDAVLASPCPRGWGCRMGGGLPVTLHVILHCLGLPAHRTLLSIAILTCLPAPSTNEQWRAKLAAPAGTAASQSSSCSRGDTGQWQLRTLLWGFTGSLASQGCKWRHLENREPSALWGGRGCWWEKPQKFLPGIFLFSQKSVSKQTNQPKQALTTHFRLTPLPEGLFDAALASNLEPPCPAQAGAEAQLHFIAISEGHWPEAAPSHLQAQPNEVTSVHNTFSRTAALSKVLSSRELVHYCVLAQKY